MQELTKTKMISVSPNSLHFGETAINDIPTYRSFKVKNEETVSLTVQLKTMNPLLHFQLYNENYASILREGTEYIEGYEEMFDFVKLISSIELEPGEEKEIICWYKADGTTFSHLSPESPAVPIADSFQLVANTALPTQQQQQQQQENLADSLNRKSPGMKRLGSSTNVGFETISVAYCVNVYVSTLHLSISEVQATMGPNKTQIFDFVAVNKSVKSLMFVIRNQLLPQRDVDIALYEAERFDEPKLGHRLLLESQARMNLSLMLRTSASLSLAKQFQAILQCDNLRNPKNNSLIYININASSETKGDLIAVSETSVNFGDIYRGAKASFELDMRNIEGREEISVRIAASDRSKREGTVSFARAKNYVDEVNIAAQNKSSIVELVFQPSADSEKRDSNKVKFDMELIATGSESGRTQKIVIRCSAVVFTSTIVVSQSQINFGDCQVGQSKHYTFSIENRSQLPCRVIVQLRSKIISIEGTISRSKEINEEFSIAPASSLPITLRIAPQRVNPMYRKQLTIINASSPTADKQIINIESNNMAPPEAKVHNEFYSWERCFSDADMNREEYALCGINNVPIIVPYVAHSKVDHPLDLRIQTTSNEIDVFVLSDPNKCAQLELVAAEISKYTAHYNSDDSAVGMHFRGEKIEEARTILLALLAEYAIVSSTIHLDPNMTKKVYAAIIRTAFTNEILSKEDGLSISVDGIEVPRFVRLSYRVCDTSFELVGQKTKNFGEINIGTKKTTKLSVVNRCRSVLYLGISKSRSVTAGHIRIDGSEHEHIYFWVRPFATKELDITFLPGIRGNFDEKIRIANMLNPKNSYTVTLKATVTKADTFEVSPDSWSFGAVVVPSAEDAGGARVGSKFSLSNTSKAQRQVRVRIDTSNDINNDFQASTSSLRYRGIDVKVQLEMELSGSSSGSSRKIEETIEKLEQKVKIYTRKKKTEKLEAALKRIDTLKRALLGEEVDLVALEGNNQGHDHEMSESEDEGAASSAAAQQKSNSNRVQTADVLPLLLRDGVALPAMGAGESVNILFGLTCTRVREEPLEAAHQVTINLLFYEANDKEINRIVPIDITLVRQEGETGSPLVPPPSTGDSSAPSPRLAPARDLKSAANPVANSIVSLAFPVMGSYCPQFLGSPLVILRNCIVNDHTEFTMHVTSPITTTVVILEPRRCGGPVAEALDARFKFFPRNGSVRAGEVFRVMVECTPRCVGPQKYLIPVKNLQNVSDMKYFVLEVNPTEETEPITTEPKELHFADCVTPCHPNKAETQLLFIRSRYPYNHAILLRTNKPSQVRFFEDAACTAPIVAPIQRTVLRETVRAYVQFRPSANSLSETARATQAGVIVEAIAQSGDAAFCVVGRCVVKASCRVGSGLLRPSTTCVNLGTVAAGTKTVSALVEVSNPSDTHVITGRLSAASANVVLEGGAAYVWRPREVKRIPVTLRLAHPGLVSESLVLTNASCAQPPVPLTLSALRADEAISASMPPPESAAAQQQGVAAAGAGLGDPLLQAALRAGECAVSTPILPVVRGEDGRFQLLESPAPAAERATTALLVHNHAGRDLVLAAAGAPELDLALVSDATPAAAAAAEAAENAARVVARATTSVRWLLRGAPEFSEAQEAQLSSLAAVSVRAETRVQVAASGGGAGGGGGYGLFALGRRAGPAAGQCVLLVPLLARFAVSEGAVDPPLLDLGVVGQHEHHHHNHSHSHQPHHQGDAADGSAGEHGRDVVTPRRPEVRGGAAAGAAVFRAWLHNRSPCLPLRVTIESPPVLRFAATRLTVPPGQSAVVEGSLRCGLVTAQGAFRYEAFFCNENNPENDMALAVCGQHYLKLFSLAAGAGGGEPLADSVTLPSLRLDVGAAALPTVAAEEKLTVTAAEREVALQLAIHGNPKLAGTVSLQLLHYEATTSVTQVFFPAPGGGNSKDAAGGGVVDGSNAAAGGTGGGSNNNSNGNPSGGGGNSNNTSNSNNNNGGRKTPVGADAAGERGGATAAAGAGNATAASAAATATSGGGPAAGGKKRKGDGSVAAAAAAAARAQTLRLRCVVEDGDYAGLVATAFGYRKRQALREPWTFATTGEMERRAAAMTSNNVWLGTISFHCVPAAEEEIEVFGKVDTFTTFAAPPKLVLRQLRRPTGAAAVVGRQQDGGESVTVQYTGEYTLTNLCAHGGATELAVMVLTAALFPVSTVVTVCTVRRDGADSGKADGSTAAATTTTVFTNAKDNNNNNNSDEASQLLSPTSASAGSGGGGGPSDGESPSAPAAASTVSCCPAAGHRVRLAPKEAATLRVTVSVSDAPARLRELRQSALEQSLAVAVVDENAPFSLAVSRVSVAPEMADDVDEERPDAAAAAGSANGTAAAAATAAVAAAAATPSAGGSAGGVKPTAAVPAGPSGAAAGASAAASPSPSRADDGAERSAAESPFGASPRASGLLPADGGNSSSGSVVVGGSGGAAADAVAAGSPAPTADDGKEGSGERAAGGCKSVSDPTLLGRTDGDRGDGIGGAGGVGGGAGGGEPPMLLSLGNCTPVARCPGAYHRSFTFPRDEPPTTDIVVRNHHPTEAVEYGVAVVSQGPLPWLLLSSGSGVIAGGGEQRLRLSLLAADVGSFMGYIAITNNLRASEYVYLRLSAEIFTPSAGEALFDVVASNGQRVPPGATTAVPMGHLYGAGATRSYVALEIANKSAVPLEFPVSVVSPFRLEVLDAAAEDGQQRAPGGGGGSSSSGGGRSPHHHRRRHQSDAGALLPSSPAATSATADSAGEAGAAAAAAAAAAAEAPPPARAPAQQTQGPPFEGRLDVCHIHGVPTRSGMRHVVVDPKSRVRIAFVLGCAALRVGPGAGVRGEIDVVFKCKQARDAAFVFRAHFCAFPPTFALRRTYDLRAPPLPPAAAASTDSTTTTAAAAVSLESGLVASAPGKDIFAVRVRNLAPYPQRLCFRTQSAVLYAAAAAAASEEPAAAAAEAACVKLLSDAGSSSPSPSSAAAAAQTDALRRAELKVAPRGAGTFYVRVDRGRAAGLTYHDSDGAARMVLNEHAFVLNKRNPQERVRLEFLQLPPKTGGGDGAADTAAAAGAASTLPAATVAATSPFVVARPLKHDGKNFSELFVSGTALHFSRVLARYQELLLGVMRAAEEPPDGPPPLETIGEAGSSSRNAGNSNNKKSSSERKSTHRSSNLSVAGAGGVSPDGADPSGGSDGAKEPRRGTATRTSRSASAGSASSTGSSSSSRSSSSSSTTSTSSSSSSSSTNSSGLECSSALSNGGSYNSATAGGGGSVAVPATPGGGGGAPVVPPSPHITVAESETASTADTTTATPQQQQQQQVRGRGQGQLPQSQAPRRRHHHHHRHAHHHSVPLTPAAAAAMTAALPHAVARGLRGLLLELTWIVDELLFYTILLRNSREVEGYCLFVASVVTGHPVTRAWLQRRAALKGRVPALHILDRFLETLDALPCNTPPLQ